MLYYSSSLSDYIHSSLYIRMLDHSEAWELNSFKSIIWHLGYFSSDALKLVLWTRTYFVDEYILYIYCPIR